jgi:hypothetical protein
MVDPMIVVSTVDGNYTSYTFTIGSVAAADCKGKRCDADLKKGEIWMNPSCYKAVKENYFNSSELSTDQSPSWGSGREVLKVQTPMAANMTAPFTIKIDTSICSFGDVCASS